MPQRNQDEGKPAAAPDADELRKQEDAVANRGGDAEADKARQAAEKQQADYQDKAEALAQKTAEMERELAAMKEERDRMASEAGVHGGAVGAPGTITADASGKPIR